MYIEAANPDTYVSLQ